MDIRHQKLEKLKDYLKSLESVAVAFSSGVDSTLLYLQHEKINLHFYINCLGFHAVEFYDSHHKDPNSPDDMIGGDYFFRFEKIVKPIELK